MKIARLFLLPLSLGLATLGLGQSAFSGSATWLTNPASNNWNTATNWTPTTVPNGASDTATFSSSNTTAISLTASVPVDAVVFQPGASAFTITPLPGVSLTLGGAGLANNSGATQNFVTGGDTNFNSGKIIFTNGAAAGSDAVFTALGGIRLGGPGGLMQFFGNASAASSTFEVKGGEARGAQGGRIEFNDSSTAAESLFFCRAGGLDTGGGLVDFADDASGGAANFVLEGATFSRSNGGYVIYEDSSGAGQSSYAVAGGTVAGAAGGILQFVEGTSAENAIITLESGAVAGAQGAFLTFSGAVAFGAASAGDANITINGGVGLGAEARFSGDATGGTARFTMSGNGRLDLSGEFDHPLQIGSIAGTGGVVLLGGRNLTAGSNNLSTTFAGTLQDGGFSGGTGGSLTEVGTGTLTLTAAGTYTGGTNVNGGALVVTNTAGSATGTGAVSVNTGRLGGGGIIAGPVSVGTSSFLSPANQGRQQATLTIQGALLFQSGSVYEWTFKARGNRSRADQVAANGVTISGASLALSGLTRPPVAAGLTLVVINNTAATPINGEFTNLTDGGIITIHGTQFQADYEGGDGNDLTLTAVP